MVAQKKRTKNSISQDTIHGKATNESPCSFAKN